MSVESLPPTITSTERTIDINAYYVIDPSGTQALIIPDEKRSLIIGISEGQNTISGPCPLDLLPPVLKKMLNPIYQVTVNSAFTNACYERLELEEKVNASKARLDDQFTMFSASLKTNFNVQSQQAIHKAWELLKEAKYEEGLKIFQRHIDAAHNVPEARYGFACCHALKGEVEEAVIALGVAVDAGFVDWKRALADSDFANMVSHAGFLAVIDRMKVIDPFDDETDEIAMTEQEVGAIQEQANVAAEQA
jgi:hypothetical protein